MREIASTRAAAVGKIGEFLSRAREPPHPNTQMSIFIIDEADSLRTCHKFADADSEGGESRLRRVLATNEMPLTWPVCVSLARTVETIGSFSAAARVLPALSGESDMPAAPLCLAPEISQLEP